MIRLALPIANIYVTNGYMTEKMLETFHPYLDAANVDLKAFRDETYRKYVRGSTAAGVGYDESDEAAGGDHKTSVKYGMKEHR